MLLSVQLMLKKITENRGSRNWVANLLKFIGLPFSIPKLIPIKINYRKEAKLMKVISPSATENYDKKYFNGSPTCFSSLTKWNPIMKMENLKGISTNQYFNYTESCSHGNKN